MQVYSGAYNTAAVLKLGVNRNNRIDRIRRDTIRWDCNATTLASAELHISLHSSRRDQIETGLLQDAGYQSYHIRFTRFDFHDHWSLVRHVFKSTSWEISKLQFHSLMSCYTMSSLPSVWRYRWHKYNIQAMQKWGDVFSNNLLEWFASILLITRRPGDRGRYIRAFKLSLITAGRWQAGHVSESRGLCISCVPLQVVRSPSSTQMI